MILLKHFMEKNAYLHMYIFIQEKKREFFHIYLKSLNCQSGLKYVWSYLVTVSFMEVSKGYNFLASSVSRISDEIDAFFLFFGNINVFCIYGDDKIATIVCIAICYNLRWKSS